MADTPHANLTGASLHEPKGVASAAANTSYIADGAGSGSWTTVPYAGLSADARGAVVLLKTNSFSGASSATFTSEFTSDYSTVLFELIDVYPASDGAGLLAQLSINSGVGYLTTGYKCTSAGRNSTSGAFDSVNNFTTSIPLTFITSSTGSAGVDNSSTVGGLSGSLRLNPLGSVYKKFTFTTAWTGTDGAVNTTTGGGLQETSSVVNGIRFLATTGNITGTIRMYGFKAS